MDAQSFIGGRLGARIAQKSASSSTLQSLPEFLVTKSIGAGAILRGILQYGIQPSLRRKLEPEEDSS